MLPCFYAVPQSVNQTLSTLLIERAKDTGMPSKTITRLFAKRQANQWKIGTKGCSPTMVCKTYY
eukprot:370341-Amphidinium_carterae.2